jgi:hypothetical protein
MKRTFLAALLAAISATLGFAAESNRPALRDYDILRAFPPGRLAALSAGDVPDANDFTGNNRAHGKWIESGPQRGSCRGVIAAVVAGDLAAADNAWRGIEAAFAHQRPDGGFVANPQANGKVSPTSRPPISFSKNSAAPFWSSASRPTRPTSMPASPRSSPSSGGPPITSPAASTPSSPKSGTP